MKNMIKWIPDHGIRIKTVQYTVLKSNQKPEIYCCDRSKMVRRFRLFLVQCTLTVQYSVHFRCNKIQMKKQN